MKVLDRTTRTLPSPTRIGLAVGLDVASIVLFVAIGRRNHDEEPGLSGVLSTAAPFLIALAIGWIVARAWWRPMSLRTGLIVWALTIVAGMLLRNLVFDDGTAASFVIVATVFTGACLLGWRLLSRVFRPAW